MPRVRPIAACGVKTSGATAAVAPPHTVPARSE